MAIEQMQTCHEMAMQMRCIRHPEDECPECRGYGVRLYSSTALWRKGIGGQAITPGVCNKCWGSGDKHRPWPNWDRMEAMQRELESLRAERAMDDEERDEQE